MSWYNSQVPSQPYGELNSCSYLQIYLILDSCLGLFYGKERGEEKKDVINYNHLVVDDYDYMVFRYIYPGIILFSNYDHIMNTV